MNDNQNPLAMKILGAIEDEPVEHIVATLGEIQVFLLVQHADDPAASVDELTGFMRATVRKIVEESTAAGCSGDRVNH